MRGSRAFKRQQDGAWTHKEDQRLLEMLRGIELLNVDWDAVSRSL